MPGRQPCITRVWGVRCQSGQREAGQAAHPHRTDGRVSGATPAQWDGTYLPVVVSARPSPAELFSCPGARVTVEVVSALAMVTSRALEVSSPQWGQKLALLTREAQSL